MWIFCIFCFFFINEQHKHENTHHHQLHCISPTSFDGKTNIHTWIYLAISPATIWSRFQFVAERQTILLKHCTSYRRHEDLRSLMDLWIWFCRTLSHSVIFRTWTTELRIQHAEYAHIIIISSRACVSLSRAIRKHIMCVLVRALISYSHPKVSTARGMTFLPHMH